MAAAAARAGHGHDQDDVCHGVLISTLFYSRCPGHFGPLFWFRSPWFIGHYSWRPARFGQVMKGFIDQTGQDINIYNHFLWKLTQGKFTEEVKGCRLIK